MSTNVSTAGLAYRPRLVDPHLDLLLTQLAGLMVVGPRACGKTTTIARRAKTIVRLDEEAEAVAFRADPDAALRSLEEPVLLDEWQEVKGVFGAVRRAIEPSPRPSRFFMTGSVLAARDGKVYAGTGRIQRLNMYPMTMREKVGDVTRRTFFDRLADREELTVGASPPDLRGYVELALESGFPVAALFLNGQPRLTWLESYVDDLLTHDVELADPALTRPRDPERLRGYLEAWALNSAGVVAHKKVFDAANIRKETAEDYRRLLNAVLILDEVPAWTSNRLKRLVHQPKRYLIDPALVASILRLDEAGVIRDGDVLGRILDTFVAAQLRPEVPISETRPRLYHLRTEGGRQEVDLLAELAGDRLIGMEIKASAAPGRSDARHLAWLRDQMGERFVAGVVFHTGPRVFELDERIVAAPIAALWN